MRNSGGLTGSCKSAYTLIIPGMFSIMLLWTQLPGKYSTNPPSLQGTLVPGPLMMGLWYLSSPTNGLSWSPILYHNSRTGYPSEESIPWKISQYNPKEGIVCLLNFQQTRGYNMGWTNVKKKKREIFRIANRQALASMHIKPMSYPPGVAIWLVLNFREVPLKI